MIWPFSAFCSPLFKTVQNQKKSLCNKQYIFHLLQKIRMEKVFKLIILAQPKWNQILYAQQKLSKKLTKKSIFVLFFEWKIGPVIIFKVEKKFEGWTLLLCIGLLWNTSNLLSSKVPCISKPLIKTQYIPVPIKKADFRGVIIAPPPHTHSNQVLISFENCYKF